MCIEDESRVRLKYDFGYVTVPPARFCRLTAFATMYRAAAVVSAIRAYNMCTTYIFHTLYVICIYIYTHHMNANACPVYI